jgi:hypothetical protein
MLLGMLNAALVLTTTLKVTSTLSAVDSSHMLMGWRGGVTVTAEAQRHLSGRTTQ